ncbi:hypothetical protein SAMN05660199_01154 [Klenkia soli]|uniref:Uncharacterized protein n=1 Tax=Klenkia soli TaxID=1052260 RepID=A0A1H0G6H1_9ACTN|nr:hypothetical protein [Klenkia soli]SDO02503.1 hypothetical protein SAMN05660199_01154 [Klenkia soli]
MLTVSRELGPVERQLGRVDLHAVDLDGLELSVGASLELLDEGGHRYPAVVVSIEPGRYGPFYSVQFAGPGTPPAPDKLPS